MAKTLTTQDYLWNYVLDSVLQEGGAQSKSNVTPTIFSPLRYNEIDF